MIRVSRSHDGEPRLHLHDEASSAFIDADWIPARPGFVRVPYVGGDGRLRWRDRQYESEAGDPTRFVQGWIAVLIEEIVTLVRAGAGDRVQVTGHGMIAEQVRLGLGAGVGPATGGAAPQVIVEMTGKPATLRRAAEDVEHGGLIILAGEAEPPTEINLYKDVHRRGLRVVGASCLGKSGAPGPDEGRDLPEPVRVRSGESPPAGLWYLVVR